MPKKIPLVSIGVQRNGKTVYPEAGVAFDFTKEEVTELTALSEKTKVDYLRDPKNEAPEVSAEKAADKKDEKKGSKGGKGGNDDNL